MPTTVLVTVIAAGLLATTALFAYPQGPDPGYTGGFGEPTCQECHFDGPLNDPGGSVSVEGIPARYTPGAAYTLTVRASRSAARRGGFQLSVRYAEGPLSGRDAGILAAVEPESQVVASADGLVHYGQHTERSSEAGPEGTLAWHVAWQSPSDARASVVLHVAANLANGDASALGDFIYTTEQRAHPAIP